MRSVSVIIVTHNAENYIHNCLSSICESKIDLDVIVIDNNSQDNTLQILNTHFSNFKVIDFKENLGFGAANNIGYKLALENNSDYIYLLNQDTISYPDSISKMVDILESNTQIGVASPMHLNDDGSKLDERFEQYISAGSCPDYISHRSLNRVEQFYEIGFVNAAAWLIKIDVVKELGGLFSKAFYHYGEDSNFLSRLRYYKKKCVITPHVFVHHLREQRFGKMNPMFEKRKLSIKKVEIMTNINNNYKNAVKILYKYAGQQMFEGNITGGIELFLYPLFFSNKIIKFRNSYKNGKVI